MSSSPQTGSQKQRPSSNKGPKRQASKKDTTSVSSSGTIPPEDGKEECFFLRLPEQYAQHMHSVIKQAGDGPVGEGYKLNIGRGRVEINGQELKAKLVDLPTVIEVHKTPDKKHLYKTGDVHQMLICKAPDESDSESDEDEEGNAYSKSIKFLHGVTPPLKNVRRKRFRKTAKRLVDDEIDVDQEVARLLAEDEDALEAKHEVIMLEEAAPKDDIAQMDDVDEDLRRKGLAPLGAATPGDTPASTPHVGHGAGTPGVPQMESTVADSTALGSSLAATPMELSMDASPMDGRASGDGDAGMLPSQQASDAGGSVAGSNEHAISSAAGTPQALQQTQGHGSVSSAPSHGEATTSMTSPHPYGASPAASQLRSPLAGHATTASGVAGSVSHPSTPTAASPGATGMVQPNIAPSTAPSQAPGAETQASGPVTSSGHVQSSSLTSTASLAPPTAASAGQPAAGPTPEVQQRAQKIKELETKVEEQKARVEKQINPRLKKKQQEVLQALLDELAQLQQDS